MISLSDQKTVIYNNKLMTSEEASAEAIDLDAAKNATLSAQIIKAHNKSTTSGQLAITFDKLISHDITYVNIIQTARAAGLEKFPVPFIMTNCHNSLCAVGGTINEDDHVFGWSAAKKYGGIFVPPNLAVLHQYVREMAANCGGMILGSDSHTRYGALGTLGVGEGGPEIVRQLLGKTWDSPQPEIIAVWLEGEPQPGVGPQDVALALIGSVFNKGFVKNKILEFCGPGIAGLTMDFRSGIDIMTTETGCISSIWPTDATVKTWMELHGRPQDYKELKVKEAALYDGLIKIDLSAIVPMIALPFHPANVYTIDEFNKNAKELLADVEANAKKLFGAAAANLDLASKIKDGGVIANQGIIAGCAGGTFENITYASTILGDWHQSDPHFTFALYPASVPVASALINNGSTERLMSLGAIVKTAFCGPCFGAGDTPAHGALSIRHTTRNFPNREGSKPTEGQVALVALMDARSIAATAGNGGKITPATSLDWKASYLDVNLKYYFNPRVYEKRVYNGFDNPQPDYPLVYGPNINDWPSMIELPEHLILEICAVITDPVTTTDELIPSGETSSLRSNPQKLAEFTLARKAPYYVRYAKQIQNLERERLQNPFSEEVVKKVEELIKLCEKQPIAYQLMDGNKPLMKEIGLGSAIFAIKPGDGSAREQAASCQKILGGWANLAEEYATKRYRSNLINWGIIPFIVPPEIQKDLKTGDYIIIPHIRSYLDNGHPMILAALIHMGANPVWSEQIGLSIQDLTKDERKIIMAGSLINLQAQEK